jgi:hypothetical protein
MRFMRMDASFPFILACILSLELQMKKYDFCDPSSPSWIDIRRRAANESGAFANVDADIAASIDACVSELRKQLRFVDFNPDRHPFGYDSVEGMIARITEAYDGVLPHRLLKNFAHLRLALDRYGLRVRLRWVRLTPDMERLSDLVKHHYIYGHLHRVFLLGSTRNRSVSEINDEFMHMLSSTLELEPCIKRPDDVWTTAARALNKAAALKGWPGKPVTLPTVRIRRNKPWEHFPASLKADFDAYFAQPSAFTKRKKLAAETVKSQLGMMLHCANLLQRTGMPADEIDLPEVLIKPKNYEAITDQEFREAGKQVTRLGFKRAQILRKIARRSGCLNKTQEERIDKALKNVRKQNLLFIENNPTRRMRNRKSYSPDVVDELIGIPEKVLREIAGARATRNARASPSALQSSLCGSKPR